MVEVVGRVGGQLVHWFPLAADVVLILGNRRPAAVSVGPTANFPVVTESKPKSDNTTKELGRRML